MTKTYRMMKLSAWCYGEPTHGRPQVWNERLESAASTREFRSYDRAFRVMLQIQDLTDDTWCVVEFWTDEAGIQYGRSTW